MTTLTKKMAEDLTDFLLENGFKVRYLHSEVDTLERVAILRDLRAGVFDVLVGINLLREGLDFPEVSLVGILDADKEGYLRSGTSLIQTIGRASRNVEGKVIMYADVVTESMARAIGETRRRREMQVAYNSEHGIEPKSVRKQIHDILSMVGATEENTAKLRLERLPRDVATKMARDLERKMRDAAAGLEFEKAAALRDELIELRKQIGGNESILFGGKAPKIFDKALGRTRRNDLACRGDSDRSRYSDADDRRRLGSRRRDGSWSSWSRHSCSLRSTPSCSGVLRSEVLRRHNDVAGFLFSAVGVLYAVVLGFVVVVVWQKVRRFRFERRERSRCGRKSLPRRRRLSGCSDANAIRAGSARLRNNGRAQSNGPRWNAAKTFPRSARRSSKLSPIPSTPSIPRISRSSPHSRRPSRREQRLFDARRARLIEAVPAVPSVLWFALVAGALAMVAFCFIFGVENRPAQLMMTAILVGSHRNTLRRHRRVFDAVFGLGSHFERRVGISAAAFAGYSVKRSSN